MWAYDVTGGSRVIVVDSETGLTYERKGVQWMYTVPVQMFITTADDFWKTGNLTTVAARLSLRLPRSKVIKSLPLLLTKLVNVHRNLAMLLSAYVTHNYDELTVNLKIVADLRICCNCYCVYLNTLQ